MGNSYENKTRGHGDFSPYRRVAPSGLPSFGFGAAAACCRCGCGFVGGGAGFIGFGRFAWFSPFTTPDATGRPGFLPGQERDGLLQGRGRVLLIHARLLGQLPGRPTLDNRLA